MAVPEELQKSAGITEDQMANAKQASTNFYGTPNYSVDANDPRLAGVNDEKSQALNDINNTYGGMVENTDKYYNDLKQSTQDWADKQAQIQQERTDFTIEQIEQEKAQANKDYQKEQSGAYVDWQKQSNAYGTEAEKMAASGLANSGFSESSQVSMYNTYQNRVATARESYNKAVLNYNNAIKDAQLQNNAALAEIAYNALQQQLTLSLEGFQYKNQLLTEWSDKKLAVDEMYWNKYTDILNQINTENALAEDVRQFESNQAFQREQNALNREHDKTMAEIEHNYNLERDKINNDFAAKEAELDRKHDKEMLKAKTKAEKELLEQQHKNDLAKLKKQQKYELAQLDKKLANDKALLKYESDLKKKNNTVVTNFTDKYKLNTDNGTKIKATNTGKNGKVTSSNILEMGYGPISGKQAATLVNEGKLTYKENKDGSGTFAKTPQTIELPTWKLMKNASKLGAQTRAGIKK